MTQHRGGAGRCQGRGGWRARIGVLAAGALVGLCFCLGLGLPLARARAAASSLVVAAPELDRDRSELALLVGAARADGSPARIESPRLLFDDTEVGTLLGDDTITDYAAEHPRWAPPMAIGLVYLWSKGGPETVMDGIEALFKHVPGRVTVYPTPYGQGYRPVLTRLTAARAAGGDLVDLPPLVGNQYKLVESIRFNASKLGEDDSAIKHLVVITDGIDFAVHDAKGFAELGEELRRKKLHVEIVWLRPQADAVQAAANVRALSEAAWARQISAESPADLRAMTESMADAIVGLRRLQFGLPWTARLFGGQKRLAVLAAVDGVVLKAQGGTLALPASTGTTVGLGLGALVLLGGGGLVVWRVGRRGGRGGASRGRASSTRRLFELLDELQHLIRIGTAAEAAVVHLSQKFPDAIDRLKTLDVQKLDPEQYRYLRTRAGQARIKEIQKQLRDSDAEPLVDREVASILSKAMTSGVEPREAARQIMARVPDNRWGALSRAGDQNLQDSLARAAQDFAPLKASHASGFAVDVRTALRAREGAHLSVGWLARASGPGRRGETLGIPTPSCVVGRGFDCGLRIGEDPELAERHAEVNLLGGEFVVRPLEGRVVLDDREVTGQRPLSDGAVVTLGSCSYVFKCVVER
jgi:hypothetical protein